MHELILTDVLQKFKEKEAVRKFKGKDFDSEEIRAYAEKFSVKRFQEEIMAFINDIKNKQQ